MCSMLGRGECRPRPWSGGEMSSSRECWLLGAAVCWHTSSKGEMSSSSLLSSCVAELVWLQTKGGKSLGKSCPLCSKRKAWSCRSRGDSEPSSSSPSGLCTATESPSCRCGRQCDTFSGSDKSPCEELLAGWCVLLGAADELSCTRLSKEVMSARKPFAHVARTLVFMWLELWCPPLVATPGPLLAVIGVWWSCSRQTTTGRPLEQQISHIPVVAGLTYPCSNRSHISLQ